MIAKFATSVVIAATIAGLSFRETPKQPEQKSDSPPKEVASPKSERGTGIPPVPAGYPQSFRIQFQTSAGETVDVRTSFFTNDAQGMTWYTHGIHFTFDNAIISNYKPIGPKQWSTMMRLNYSNNRWTLKMGTGYVFNLDNFGYAFDPATFAVSFPDISGGSIKYTGFTVSP